MQRMVIVFFIVLAGCSAQARVFTYGLFIHRIDGQVKVDVYAPFENHLALTVPEAIAFLKTAPHSRGPNQIGVLAEGCGGADYAALLQTIVSGSFDMELVYFEGFGADGLRTAIE